MANQMRNDPGTQGNKLRCDQCNMEFQSQQELDRHNRESHNR